MTKPELIKKNRKLYKSLRRLIRQKIALKESLRDILKMIDQIDDEFTTVRKKDIRYLRAQRLSGGGENDTSRKRG